VILWCAALSWLAWLCVCTVVGVAGAAAGCAGAASIHCQQRWAMKQVWAMLLAGGWAGQGDVLGSWLGAVQAWAMHGWHVCWHGSFGMSSVAGGGATQWRTALVDSSSVRSSSSPCCAWCAAMLLSMKASDAWYSRRCTGLACVACCPVHKTQRQAVFNRKLRSVPDEFRWHLAISVT
jgi:hypothetical protein